MHGISTLFWELQRGNEFFREDGVANNKNSLTGKMCVEWWFSDAQFVGQN